MSRVTSGNQVTPRFARRQATALVAVLLMSSLSAFAPTAAAATTLTVCASGCDHTSIGAAVVAASAGDTIDIAAGSYVLTAPVVVDKPLTLLGPQAGVDPRPSAGSARVADDAATEAILDGGGALSNILQIAADDVTVDGLVITGGEGDLVFSAEAHAPQRTLFTHNIVHGSEEDDNLQLRGCVDCVVSFSLFFDSAQDAINVCCSASGGVIHDNEVASADSKNGAIYVYSATGMVVRDNLVRGNARAAVTVYDTTGATIDGNDIEGMAWLAGIRVRLANTDVTITHNVIKDNGVLTDQQTTYGVYVDPAATNVVVNHNDIAGNEFGVLFDVAASYTGPPLDARHNWWGDAAGPTHATNANGAGDAVSDHVDFGDFAAASLTDGPIRIADVADNACAPGDLSFHTIAAAVSCALPHATVLVEPGTYVGGHTIDRALTLCSTTVGGTACDPQTADTVIDGGRLYPVYVDADDVTVQGFTIQNPLYDGVDAGANWVDPSLVVVYGDRVSIIDNVLRDAARVLAPTESRKYTVGVNIGAGSDDTLVANNVIERLPASRGGGVTCANAPCSTVAVFNWGGGSGMVVRDNVIRLPTGEYGGGPISVGVHSGSSSLRDAVVADNTITIDVGAAPGAMYGVYGFFLDSTFSGNAVSSAVHGIFLRSTQAGGNTVTGNTFTLNREGLRNYAGASTVMDNTFQNNIVHVFVAGAPANGGSSAGFRMNTNVFRGGQTMLQLHADVAGAAVNARENDWGAYTRDEIEALIVDDNGSNDVDVSCFIDADGVTRVCAPLADFTWNPATPGWQDAVTFTDTSTPNPRPIASRSWDVAGQASGSGSSITHRFNALGSFDVTLTLTDTEGFSSSVMKTVTTGNAAPVLDPIGDRVVAEGGTLAFTVTASDPNNDAVTLQTFGTVPPGSSFDAASGSFTYAPPYGTGAQAFTFTFNATDGMLGDEETITVTVTDVNPAPVLHFIGDRSVDVITQGTLAFTVSGTDFEGDTLTFGASNLPTGASFDPATQAFTWTPTTAQVGVYPAVRFTLTDGVHTVFEDITITVTRDVAPGVTIESLATDDLLGSPGDTLEMDFFVRNTGLATDTVSFTPTGPAGWSFSGAVAVTLAPAEGATVTLFVTVGPAPYRNSVQLRATSSFGPTAFDDVTVLVPIVLSLATTQPSFGFLQPVTGTVTAAYLNGAPAANAEVLVLEQSARAPPLTLGVRSITVTTGPDGVGVIAFELNPAGANQPGDHLLRAQMDGQPGQVPRATYAIDMTAL